MDVKVDIVTFKMGKRWISQWLYNMGVKVDIVAVIRG